MSKKHPPLCHVCAVPGSLARLIRLTWDAPNAKDMRLVVASSEKKSDALVCEDCIRDIKRIPFSDLHDALTAS